MFLISLLFISAVFVSDVTSEKTVVPATPGGSPAVPSGSPAVPSGSLAVPSGSVAAASGSPAVPSGSPAVPSGSPAAPSGSPAAPSGTPAVPRGSPAAPSGSPEASSGSPAAPSSSPAAPSGSPAKSSGSPAAPSGSPAAPGNSPAARDSKSSQILFVAPFGSQSHKNFYDAVIRTLAEDGYKITVLTPFRALRKHKNVKEVVFEDNSIAPVMPNSFKEGLLAATLNAMETGPSMCFSALASQRTKAVLQKKFDLVFVSLFFNECFLGAVHSMKVPVVLVNPVETFGPYTARRMGTPTFPSFTYNPMLNFDAPLNFLQRLVSTLSEVAFDWMTYSIYQRIDVTGHSLGLFSPDTPPTTALSANASLMLVNSVRLAEHPRPYMPNIVFVGGIHCRPAAPLPKELEAWVEGAGPAGVIYFSLGSAVSTSHLDKTAVRTLLSVFGSLPQRVLWKYDESDLPLPQPDNVRLIKWAPQQDLLGHKRIRLFITHGGILSTQEAIYHEVPVLGLPVFGDQEGNMATAQAQGWGRKLSWDNLTEDQLKDAIEELLESEQSLRAVRHRAALMRDAPLNPNEELRWWTRYLLKTGGAPHLRSPATDLTWYQLHNTDVWLLVLLAVLLLLWLQLKLLRAMYRRCCASKDKKTKEKPKQN